MKIDWERLNHVFIPVPTAERRRRVKPLSPRAARLLDLLFSVTGVGQALLLVGCVVGTLSLAAPRSRLAFVSGTALGLFALSIAVRGRFRIRDGRARLEQPARVTVGEVVEVRVVVTSNERADDLSVRGPFLPYFARYEGGPPTLVEERGTGALAATVRVRFLKRSDLFLGPFAVARRLPFDVVAGPPIETEPFRIKIVPRPARITRLDLRPAHDSALEARRATRRAGLSDLAGVREYRPGDRIRDLDVRTWARTGVPAVREYHEPERPHALLVLDTDAEAGEAFEAAVSLVAGVAETVSTGALALELLVLGEALHPLGASRGREVLPLVSDALAVTEARSGGFDARRLLARLAPYLDAASSVVFVTTRWDDARADVTAALTRRGLLVRTLVVAEPHVRGALPLGVLALTPTMIKRGGLAL